MPDSKSREAASVVPAIDPDLATRLHIESEAAIWGVTVDRFSVALLSSVAHGLHGEAPGTREVEAYCRSLRLQDLALAVACEDGHEAAWEHFVREIRPVLYRAADALDPTGGARDLADGLYGELFGVRNPDGPMRSLFRYFHGRSSLATWVRSVLAQRFVDRTRAQRPADPLPDEDAPSALKAPTTVANPDRPRMVAVVGTLLAAAIAALSAKDRLALGCYYGEQLKLAAIGRLLDESEATVSRRLTRVRRELRDEVARRLSSDHGLDDATVTEYLQVTADHAGELNLDTMLDFVDARKKPDPDRSTEGGPRVSRA